MKKQRPGKWKGLRIAAVLCVLVSVLVPYLPDTAPGYTGLLRAVAVPGFAAAVVLFLWSAASKPMVSKGAKVLETMSGILLLFALEGNGTYHLVAAQRREIQILGAFLGMLVIAGVLALVSLQTERQKEKSE